MQQSKYFRIRFACFLISLFVFTFIPPKLTHSDTADLALIVSEIQKKYESVKEVEAVCVEETFNKTLDKKFKFKGMLYIKKPDKVRMEIKEPEEQLIVANGSFIWIYIPENNQVVKEKMDENNKSKLAITILTGMAKLDRDFNIYKDQGSSKNYIVRLIPKESTGFIKKMNLEINKKKYDIEKVVVEDSLGNWTSYELSEVKINSSISDSKFDFKIPGGVELVESSGE